MIVENLFKKGEIITLESYLKAYGVQDVEKYLHPPTSVLESCWIYDNMRELVDELKYAILTDSRICIVGDSDADGVCSAYIIYKTLKLHNKKLNIKIVLPNGKERGIEPQDVRDEIKRYKADYVIIPDGGTNSKGYENDLNGAKVLVIDHHNPNAKVCEHALIVNNTMNTKQCNTELSGTGVTFKVCQALDFEFGTKYSNRFIDLVGFTIISDSMDIRTLENRWFIDYILDRDNIENPFLNALFDEFIGDNEYTQRDISFKIVPKINSVIRCGTKEDRQKLYTAMLGKNIEDTIKMCAEYHQKQIKIVDDFIKHHKSEIDSFKNDNVVIIQADDVPKTFSGLIAGRISGSTNKPTIVGKLIEGELKGSYRGQISSQDLLPLPQVKEVAGHDYACGITLVSSDLGSFKDEMNKMDISTIKEVTFSFGANNVPTALFTAFRKWDCLWGHALDKPSFYIYDIKVNKNNLSIMKDKHIKIKANGYEVIIWNCKSRFNEFGIIETEDGFESSDEEFILNVIASADMNVWRNNRTNQFIVDEFEVNKVTNTFEDLM